MPKIKSAEKALRQNKKRREKNLAKKRQVKRTIKEYKKLIDSGNAEEASQRLNIVYKTLDKAAKTGIIKKNKSSRLKSRVSSQLNRARAQKSNS
jgi:small subunit ribosomal protein S20